MNRKRSAPVHYSIKQNSFWRQPKHLMKTIFWIPTAQIDPETQKRLNMPLRKEGNLDPEDQMFLNAIMAKAEKGEIQLFTPSSLLNHTVYDALAPEKQAVVDQQSFATLAALREIVNLWKAYQIPTFQLQNLIHNVRLTKERFEKEIGDVFVI